MRFEHGVRILALGGIHPLLRQRLLVQSVEIRIAVEAGIAGRCTDHYRDRGCPAHPESRSRIHFTVTLYRLYAVLVAHAFLAVGAFPDIRILPVCTHPVPKLSADGEFVVGNALHLYSPPWRIAVQGEVERPSARSGDAYHHHAVRVGHEILAGIPDAVPDDLGHGHGGAEIQRPEITVRQGVGRGRRRLRPRPAAPAHQLSRRRICLSDMEIAHGQECRSVGPLQGHQQLPRSIPVLGEQRFAHLPQDLGAIGRGIVIRTAASPQSGFVEVYQVIVHSAIDHGADMAIAKRQRFIEVRGLAVISHDLRRRRHRHQRCHDRYQQYFLHSTHSYNFTKITKTAE